MYVYIRFCIMHAQCMHAQHTHTYIYIYTYTYTCVYILVSYLFGFVSVFLARPVCVSVHESGFRGPSADAEAAPCLSALKRSLDLVHSITF